jgi:hypothetical protein
MTDVLIRRRPYGSLLCGDCESVLIDFFRRNISSVDGDLSYDDRAMARHTDADHHQDAFDEVDATVIRRGMGLNRHPKTGWQWLVEEAPTDLVADLPDDDLGDVSDDDYPEIRPRIEAALGGFIGETGQRRGLATATKMLYLKRPGLIPICDSYTVAMLGIPLRAEATKEERVQAGLTACDLIRAAAREDREQLTAICEQLASTGYARTPVRVLDALLWISYGGNIREGRPALRTQPGCSVMS